MYSKEHKEYLKNIWWGLALKLFNNLILFSSTSLNACFTLIIVIIIDMNKAMMIIDLVPAPASMIIIGPSETLGRLFNMVK